MKKGLTLSIIAILVVLAIVFGIIFANDNASKTKQITDLNTQIDSLTADVKDKTSQIDTLTADAADKASQIETLTADAADKASQIETLTADAADKASQIEALTADVADKASQVDTLTANAGDSAGQIETLLADVADKAAQIETLTADAADKAAQIETLTASVADKDAQIETLNASVADKDAQIETLNASIADKDAQIAEKQTAIDALNVQVADLGTQIEALKAAPVEEKVEEVTEAVEETVAAAEEAVAGLMTYADYAAAELETPVKVQCYVQAHQSWWDNKVTVYAADKDGAYFIYELACSEEDAAKLVPGTLIEVEGFKAAWSGEVEITDAKFTFVDGEAYVASALDVTDKLGSEELINFQNQFVSFTDMTVVAYTEGGEDAFAYQEGKGGHDGNADIYFKVSKNDAVYEFCIESYLTDNTTDVYAAVENLKVGDVVDLQGFLYWYNGANPHITAVTVK